MKYVFPLKEEIRKAIAAGEVVESPVSVVKELFENAVDAGAESVEVQIEGGGMRLIRVTDDGEGIHPEDLPLVIERYTTSKVQSLDDLLQLETYGFRGEALHAIAAVSRLRIRTKWMGSDEGRVLEAVEGQVKVLRVDPWRRGTQVEVSDLFFNTPARRKFMRSPQRETAAAAEMLRRLAVPLTHMRVKLLSEKRDVFLLYARSGPQDRYIQATGLDVHLEGFDATTHGIRVYGWLTPAEWCVRTSRKLYIYVNNRWIKDDVIFSAVMGAYGNLVEPSRYPAGILFVELDPEEVDVNVHPRKESVRFMRPSDVYEAVRTAVQELHRISVATPANTETFTSDISETDTGEKKDVNRITFSRKEFRSPGLNEPSPMYLTGKEPDTWKFHGIAFGRFAMVERMDEIVFLDVHAAAEQVVYASLMKNVEEGGAPRVPKLVPEVVTLSSDEKSLLSEMKMTLERMGFVVEDAGPHAVAVREVPQVLQDVSINDIIRAVTSDETRGVDAVRNEISHICATIACHSVVRGFVRMGENDVLRILKMFFDENLMKYCPHGRPLMFSISRSELERRFKRR